MADKITSDQFETPEILAAYAAKQATFKRGSSPTPPSEIEAADKHVIGSIGAAPAQFAQIAKNLNMEGNSQFGDCVSAESAAAIMAASVRNGGTEVVVPQNVTIAWARKHGYLNGANLVPVMNTMNKNGMTVGGKMYCNGPHASVKFGDVPTLRDAVYVGPVKIGIDSHGLPSGAGNKQGWFALGGSPHEFNSEDHCIGIWGYGAAAWLYQQLAIAFPGVTLPANLPGTTEGFLLYTWSTVGFMDHARIMAMTGEAWVRNPTIVIGTPHSGGDMNPIHLIHKLQALKKKHPRLNPSKLIAALLALLAAIQSGNAAQITAALAALVKVLLGAPGLAKKLGINTKKLVHK